MDRKKKLITLFLSSAVAMFWACGEGSINEVTDTDERGVANLLEKLDSTKKDYEKNVHEFVDRFLEYCNSKEGHKDGCEAEYKKSSSSKSGDNGSASSNSSSSKTTNSSSSGNVNTSSSKGGTNSSSGGTSNSSSSKPANSSSSTASSSSKKLEAKGKCVLSESVVYIGDEVIWRYLPDEGSLESAEFTWSFNDDDVKNGVVSGKISGTGTPELLVKFTTKGLKTGPTLTFDGKGLDCDNVKVVAKDEPKSSSSEPESSSSEPESSSSSSAPMVKGYCAVSKRVITVGETVEWFIVDAERQELEGRHQWIGYGDGTAQYVSGEEKGTGSTRVVVQYLQPGDKAPQVTWDGKTVTCERDELNEDDFDPLLRVEALPESSSSEEPPEESSSSSGETDSSSSSYKKPVDCVLEPDDPACTSYDF